MRNVNGRQPQSQDIDLVIGVGTPDAAPEMSVLQVQFGGVFQSVALPDEAFENLAKQMLEHIDKKKNPPSIIVPPGGIIRG